MDTAEAAVDSVAEGLAKIKAYMPETYKAIKGRAQQVGSGAYGQVRRALKGEANCFWACERGQVVGTPFAGHEIERDVAHLMVQFGTTFVVMWGEPVGGVDGKN